MILGIETDIFVIICLALFALLSGAAIILLVRGLLLRRSMQPSHSQTDLTNMMILFQTMRDILAQQKDLAREFNISIDKKVNEVRRLIDSAGDVRQQLDTARREIANLSQQTRGELTQLQKQLTDVDRSVGGPAVRTQTVSVAEPEVEPEPVVEVSEAVGENPTKPFEIIPLRPEADEPDLIDRWTGVDFGDADDDEPEEDEDASLSEEETQEDASQTREAFRSLLNIDSYGPDSHDNGQEPQAVSPEGPGQYLTPIQKRIYEYSDAGMRVPEIARELGVGKGEVRLILSLRQNRSA